MGDQSAIKAGGKLPPLIATRLPEELEHEMEAETRSHYRENKSEYAQFGEPRRSRPVQFSDEKLQSRRQIVGRPIILPQAPPDFIFGVPPSNRFEVCRTCHSTCRPRHPNTQNVAAPLQGP
jgi:hypothetical protein